MLEGEAKDRAYSMLSAEHDTIMFQIDMDNLEKYSYFELYAITKSMFYAVKKMDERLHAIGYERIDETIKEKDDERSDGNK